MARTGAERYLAKRLKDKKYRATYKAARRRIDAIDQLIRSLDERREELALTKAALAEEAGLPNAAVRRLFSTESPNPTLSTVLALADALDMTLEVAPERKRQIA